MAWYGRRLLAEDRYSFSRSVLRVVQLGGDVVAIVFACMAIADALGDESGTIHPLGPAVGAAIIALLFGAWAHALCSVLLAVLDGATAVVESAASLRTIAAIMARGGGGGLAVGAAVGAAVPVEAPPPGAVLTAGEVAARAVAARAGAGQVAAAGRSGARAGGVPTRAPRRG